MRLVPVQGSLHTDRASLGITTYKSSEATILSKQLTPNVGIATDAALQPKNHRILLLQARESFRTAPPSQRNITHNSCEYSMQYIRLPDFRTSLHTAPASPGIAA